MNPLLERKTIQCNYELTDDEWRCIEVYRRRAAEFLEERRLINPGKLNIHFSREEDGNLSGNASLPPERELKHLYWSFRFFYQKKEPSHFHKVANIVSKTIDDPTVREAIKRIKAQWLGSFAETLSKFHGKNYSSEEIIDCWLNAHYCHSDLEKEEKLSKLKSLLKNDLSRISFFMSVWDAGLAISNLYLAIERLGRTNGEFALPLFMARENTQPNTKDNLGT